MSDRPANPATKSVLRWLTLSVVVGVALVAAGSAGLWYHLFGREGTPVESYEMEAAEASEAVPWRKCKRMVMDCVRKLRTVDDLTATLHKQERIDNRLEPMCTLAIKQRTEPLSLYLKWIEPNEGREVIFELQKRGNRLIAHEGGALRLVSPDIWISRTNPLAQKFSRHPISELSIPFVRRELPKYVDAGRADPDATLSIDYQEQVGGQECVHIRIQHAAPMPPPTTTNLAFTSEEERQYDRFDLYISKKTRLPVRWETYLGQHEGDPQLVEYFELSDLQTNVGLSDNDFDPANPDYDFRPDWRVELDGGDGKRRNDMSKG